MSEEHKVIYFQPGQLIFLVEGDSSDESAKESLVKELDVWANGLAKDKYAKISNFHALTFQPPSQPSPDKKEQGPRGEESRGKRPYRSPEFGEKRSFALVSAEVTGFDPADLDHDGRLLDLIISLDNQRRSTLGGRLQVVSPNWLTSGGSEPGTVGGPGGKPTPFDGPASTNKYEFTLEEKLMKMIKEGGQGEGVIVAILDTAPTNNEDLAKIDPRSLLAKIYAEWVTGRPNDPHSLISRLLNPDEPRLTLHLNPEVDRRYSNILPDERMQVDGHEYEMTDHGLFVAGIIHSLAPQAELHLFQVLNRFGVGDLLSFAQALQQVYDEFSDSPLVINSSLTFNIPSDKAYLKNADIDIGRKLAEISEGKWKEWKDWFDRQNLLAEWICDLAYGFGSRMIAAAGNNRGRGQARPQACYPAAFERVLGVGALPKSPPPQDHTKKLKTASYSNLSDRPGGTGITTLGGEEGKEKGVLGIYIGQFPPETNSDKVSNTKGWGWWAGTSFATPIISGITAALLTPGKTTEEVIGELFKAQDLIAEDDEDVLFVTQGT
jgi:hypothetical protein